MGRELILDTIRFLQSWFRRQPTVPAKKVLLLYREPGVLDFYRPSDQPWRYYLASVWQLHNETVNIWTHIFAALSYVYTLVYYSNEFNYLTDRESWPILTFAVACIVNVSLSVIAHTLHSKSPVAHYTCYQADYAGIGFYYLGVGMLLFYSSSEEEWVRFAKPFFLPTLVFLCWLFAMCCCVAKLRYRRPYPFRRRLWQLCSGSLVGSFVFAPVFIRYSHCLEDKDCSLSSLNHHVYPLVIVAISVFFFSSHFPEKIWPGRFDIVGQGHHLFHVLVPVFCILQINAAHRDLRDHSRSLKVHHVALLDIILSTVAYVLMCLLTVIAFRPVVQKRIAQDLKAN